MSPAAPAAGAPSDYVALSSFDELPLSDAVRQSIQAKGYTKPTPVQAAALRPILARKDVIVRSKTGTGKTAAFGIPLVELVDTSKGHVQGIVLCNTRELALQVSTEVASLGEHKGVKVVAIYGGASMDDQLRALNAGAQVVVGTPGRVIDLLERGKLKLDQGKIAVLDEADEMLGVGFLEDVMKILGKMPKGHQTLLFSATLTPDIERLIRTHLKEPETLLLAGDTYTVEGIRNIFYYAKDTFPKPRNLLCMMQLENPETAIIFCNTRDDVNLIASVLNRNGFDAERLSGELSQSERERVMARIKRGELSFMVATDLAARGIDISDLTHVINYSLPEDPAVYLHRIGRTGRIGKTGTALSLVRGTEIITLSALQKRFGIQFEEKQMPSPEEAQKMWAESHVKEMKGAMGTQIADAFLPLAQELRKREDGDQLLAFALKYFFSHHRMEKAAAQRQDEEVRAVAQKKEEQKKPLQERREQRAKPKLEGKKSEAPLAADADGVVAAESAEAAAEQEEGEEQAPQREGKRNRLYVGLGQSDGLDEAAVRQALVELTGQSAESIQQVEMKPGHSYVEVQPELVEQFLAANGKQHGEKAITIEVARPPSSSRRRRRR